MNNSAVKEKDFVVDYWVILHALLAPADFQNQIFQKHSFRNTIRVSNHLDPDLGPNCLQRFSEDDKSHSLQEMSSNGPIRIIGPDKDSLCT